MHPVILLLGLPGTPKPALATKLLNSPEDAVRNLPAIRGIQINWADGDIPSSWSGGFNAAARLNPLDIIPSVLQNQAVVLQGFPKTAVDAFRLHHSGIPLHVFHLRFYDQALAARFSATAYESTGVYLNPKLLAEDIDSVTAEFARLGVTVTELDAGTADLDLLVDRIRETVVANTRHPEI